MGREWGLIGAALAIALISDPVAGAPTAGLRVAPAPDGRIGAWLVAGPFKFAAGTTPLPKTTTVGDLVPAGVDESKLAPRAGTSVGDDDPHPWQVVASDGATLDLKAALGLSAKDKDVVAYAGAVLEIARGGRYVMWIGAGDGVRVFVDGKVVFTRDEWRPPRDDEDEVLLDLAPGAHTVVVKLRQRDGAFVLPVRFVDETVRAPAGAALVLPGATADDGEKMLRRMSFVTVDRGLTETGYEPRVLVRFPDGMPTSPPARLSARVLGPGGETITSAPPIVVPPTGVLGGEAELALPTIEGDALARVEDRAVTVEVDLAGRIVRAPFYPRRATRLAARRALFALEALPASRPGWLKSGSSESVDHLRRRLIHLVSRGDGDAEAQVKETKELDLAAARLEAERDPFEGRTGFLRRAYRAPIDGDLAPYGLYVPDSYRSGAKRTYPLIVVLHGLNGKPMAMLRWFFGGDDPKKDQEWEERHLEDLPPLDAFVLSPNGHGNSMYRFFGQDDVMRALDEVMALYPIDASRVTITGPSMGGIGSASLAFRHPDRFAAAEPLCGYHSLFVRGDVKGRALRPWEKFLAEERSNVFWAPNGHDLPLYVVHGTQDLPVENSGVLIERYEALKYKVEHEHPVLGHNVWQPTYEDLKGAKWLLGHSRDVHPKTVRFRTARSRDGHVAWVDVLELAASDAWAEIDARARSRTALAVTTKGVGALRIDRDEKVFDPTASLEVTLDGQKLAVPANEAVEFHREGATWKLGLGEATGPRKRTNLSGPFRDVFHEPLLFVYGTIDPAEARANEEVARAFARVRWGVDVHYPIMSDREFVARGEPLANDRALFLVGSGQSNAIVRMLEPDLPITVARDGVTIGGKRITGGRELGAAFVWPNPKRPDRYVAVVAGATALGTWRALSLPDLVPDFMIYDDRLAPARGQILLGGASVLGAGFFNGDWSLPAKFVDPLARAPRRATPTTDSAESAE